NKFVKQSFKKGASLAIVNKIQTNINKNRQIKVQNSLKFLTESSKIFRKNINTKIISITGSCGKTTLKELLGKILKKISRTSISPKSFNNRLGVPLSLFNLKQNDDFGVLEVGMDKKGEIDYLSKIIFPDVSVITNVNYAHAKNFKNIENIASAKAEIIPNTKSNGFVVLNADDNFFSFHKKIALKNNLCVKSFGIKNQISNIKLIRIKKEKKKI
ncbi:MAG: UDP-N-acetylmuramoylalanyl-D-glutamate--2,6-diaminopimelate ligase, partial [Flavobacteriaceae bacterium]|nr:UDP-N-acetylmuramoylalanyl-D-glutamate--2,6-diaminopimelate ligase [Flavobacteriaceae bacterium]